MTCSTTSAPLVLQVLVEGGAGRPGLPPAGLVDRYVVYLAPALFGGDDARWVARRRRRATIDDVWRDGSCRDTLGDDLAHRPATREERGDVHRHRRGARAPSCRDGRPCASRPRPCSRTPRWATRSPSTGAASPWSTGPGEAGGRPTSSTRRSSAPPSATASPATGQPRAPGPAQRPPGRPHRAGPRRRGRRDRPRRAPDLRVRMPADLLRYVVEKGSITVDGVSLTVVDVLDDGFTVAVIPHTLEVTTLGPRAPATGQPRGGRHRQVRRAPAHLDESDRAKPDRSPRSKTPSPRSAGRDPRGRRRRGPRERGRPDHGGRVRHPGEDRPSSCTTRRASSAPRHRERARELDLPLMVVQNTESQRTAFMVTVDSARAPPPASRPTTGCATSRR